MTGNEHEWCQNEFANERSNVGYQMDEPVLTTLCDLPDAVLLQVLSHLKHEYLLTVSLTCRRIQRLCLEIAGELHALLRVVW